jgi:general secretion pathway protein D
VRTRTAILCLVLCACLKAADPSAWDLYEQGRDAEKAGHMAQAYLLYSEAAALEPKNQTYWLRSQAVQSRALLETKTAAAVSGPAAAAAKAAPGRSIPEATLQDRLDSQKPLPPSELAARPLMRDFNLRGDSQKLFEEVAKAYGLECVFDGDYQPVRSFRFEITGVDYRTALRALEASTASFIVPLTSKLFLVAKDTPQKRAQLEPNVAVEAHIDNIGSQQDFTAVVTAVQQTFAIQRVAFDTQNSTVILRGPMSAVIPARAMLEDLMHPRAQVMIEMKLVEVTRNDMLTYGVNFPTSFPLIPLTNWMNNQISVPSNIAGLLTFGGGLSLMGIGIMNASLVAQMSDARSQTLLQTEVRSLDGQAAELHVGDRYPVLTSGYFAAETTQGTQPTQSQTSQIPGSLIPSFTFEDLGVVLKVKPQVHDMRELSLDIDAEFKVLAGQALNGIPIIASRVMKSQTRLKFGDWAAISGLLNSSEAHQLAGVAGLSQIPYVGPIFGTRNRNRSRDEVLIFIRAHLLTPPPTESVPRTILIGSDTRPLTQF